MVCGLDGWCVNGEITQPRVNLGMMGAEPEVKRSILFRLTSICFSDWSGDVEALEHKGFLNPYTYFGKDVF